MMLSQKLTYILVVLFTFSNVGSAKAQSKSGQDPFYLYGFPQDQIYVNIDKASKEGKKVAKLKLKGVDLSLKRKKLGKFKNLVVLNLEDNKLDSLPIGIYKNTNLKYLRSSGNSLTRLNEDLVRFRYLKELHLIGTKLDSFPRSFTSLSQISHLEIQSNSADTFYTNESFSNLKVLEEVLLYNVNLKEFPTKLTAQKTLLNFYLVQCNVPKIDSSLYKCENLEVLVLEGNKLTKIDREIVRLKKLEVLNLKNNDLKSLPEFITKLKNLKSLDVTGNSIPYYEIEIVKILLPKCTVKYSH